MIVSPSPAYGSLALAPVLSLSGASPSVPRRPLLASTALVAVALLPRVGSSVSCHGSGPQVSWAFARAGAGPCTCGTGERLGLISCKRFQAEVLHKFSSSVHHTSSSPDGSFFMLVVFRRFLFRLTEDSVAMALHCCLGGSPAGFHVSFQNERHFRFSVASKHVSLLVRALNRITTDHFDIYFHMWRDGGADWKREWRKWEKEEKDSWITISSKRSKRKISAKKVSFDEKLIQDSPVRKSHPRELTSVFRVGDVLCPASPLTCFVFGSKSTILNLGKPSEFSSCNRGRVK